MEKMNIQTNEENTIQKQTNKQSSIKNTISCWYSSLAIPAWKSPMMKPVNHKIYKVSFRGKLSITGSVRLPKQLLWHCQHASRNNAYKI